MNLVFVIIYICLRKNLLSVFKILRHLYREVIIASKMVSIVTGSDGCNIDLVRTMLLSPLIAATVISAL
jgi:hypothetical protein